MANDQFRLNGLAGNTLHGETIIDAHMHIDQYNKFLMPVWRLDSLIANARRIGIQQLYGSSLLAIRHDMPAGNANALSSRLKYPGLFHPYLVIKPNYPEELNDVLITAEREKINQFKLHDDGNGFLYDDRRYFPLYEYADAHASAILFHTYGKMHLTPIMNIARQFRSIRILLAHSGIVDEEMYYDAVRSFDNVHLETCNSMAWHGLIERMVNAVGADRILFGTDMPFMSPDQQIGRVLFARIRDDEKRRILGLNAERLFRS